MSKPSKQQIINELWRRSEIDFLFRPEQKKMEESFAKQTGKILTLLCSRRLGKTYKMFGKCVQICLKNPYAVAKYLFPEKAQGSLILEEVSRQLFETCPPDVMPEWQATKQRYVFPNGSQIQIGGIDDRGGDSLRGGSSDICVLDEIGFADSKYVNHAILNVLLPTMIHNPKAKIYLISTPPKTSTHVFYTDYVKPLLAQKKIEKLTVYESSVLTTEEIEQSIAVNYPKGLKDPEFLREFMCEMSDDVASKIFPEADQKYIDTMTFNEYKLPPYFDYYVSGDIGFKDLTVYLFGYWNFHEAKLYVLDELVIHGPSLNGQSLTQVLASGIQAKERELFGNQKPYMRLMDNDLIIINNLNTEHGLNFIPTQKDNKEGAVNTVRLMLNNKQIMIHSRCKHLLYHMQYGEWDQKASRSTRGFLRIPDSPDKTIRGGHCDAADALIYMCRQLLMTRNHNPYPKGYDAPLASNSFTVKNLVDTAIKTTEMYDKIMNAKSNNALKVHGGGFFKNKKF